MTTTRLKSTDVVVLDEIRRRTQEDGYCALSTRQFYELTGIGRKTIQRSLSRLATAGLALRLRASQGGASAHWIALPAGGWTAKANENGFPIPSIEMEAGRLDNGGSQLGVALIDPRKDGQTTVPDAFRRSDLRSPWLLYTRLPVRPLTLDEAVRLSGLTTRRRTVERWLLILASLVPPLVEASSADRDCIWTKLPVDECRLAQLAAHLEAITSASGHGRRLHTAHHAQLKNQLERETNLWRREARLG